MEFIKYRPSTSRRHKYDAVFRDGNREKVVRFGSANHSDYTLHGDDDRRRRYIARHQPNEDWSDPLTAGFHARWVLWHLPNINDSMAAAVRLMRRLGF